MLIDLLRTTTVDSLAKPAQIVTLNASETPRDAFIKLVSNNIRSAPVWDDKANDYVGFLDVRDLVSFVVFEQHEEELHNLAKDTGTTEFLDFMLKSGTKMYDMPMSEVTLHFLARRHSFYCVNQGATLEEVAKLLVQKRCHRVPVMDSKGEIVNIVSQSALIQFLNQRKNDIGALGKHTIAHSMCGTSPVLNITTANNVLDAFRIIASNDIMGVAVVDKEGHFVGNTSASDLKEFLRSPSTSLNMPIMDFLARIRQQNLKSVHPAISVSPSDTLEHVIGKLAATKIHRIFVCHQGKPIAVISLSDILKYAYLATLLRGDDME